MSVKLTGLKEVVTDLDGNAVTQNEELLTIGKALSTVLLRGKSGDPLTAVSLAKLVLQEDELEVSDEHKNVMIKHVQGDGLYTNLVKARLLSVLLTGGIE